jgi:N utilization substance protein A
LCLAIGKGGLNIRLAGKLTGYNIDVFRDTADEEYDIDLDEFADEIEGWVIEEFKRIGCDTARSVLDLTADELERRTDLERVTIDEVRKVLKEECEQC